MSNSMAVISRSWSRSQAWRRVGVDPDAAGFEHLGFGRLRATGAAEYGSDARQQFLRSKWLGQIIVGTGIKARHAIRLGGPRGQHDHRGLTALAQLPQQLEAVQDGQHHVEEDEIEIAFERAGQAGLAIVYRINAEPLLRKVILH